MPVKDSAVNYIIDAVCRPLKLVVSGTRHSVWKSLSIISLITLLAACGGGSASDGSIPQTLNPPPPSDPTPGVGRFTIVGQDQVVPITEGSNGISINVAILRQGGHQSPVTLSLAATEAGAADDLSYSFSQDSLVGTQSRTTLTLRLAIAMGPIQPQQRRLSVAATDGTTTQRQTLVLSVTPVLAPDVYLLVGQSNMEGFSLAGAKSAGPGGADEPDARIQQLNVMRNNYENFGTGVDFLDFSNNFAYPRLVPAEDPLHDAYDPAITGKGGTRIGPGLSFAKAAQFNTTQNIVLVPAAWAGTAFCDNTLGNLAWNPEPTANANLGGTRLFDRAVLRANAALEESGGILRGILWHQGESDSTNAACANQYEDNLKKLVESLRTEIQVDARGSSARGPGAAVPFIAGTMSRGGVYADYGDVRTTVDTVHRNIASLIPFAELSNHDDLVPPAYTCGQDSCIHFGAGAYREMGQRYNESLQSILAR